jgi:hypothetical protein
MVDRVGTGVNEASAVAVAGGAGVAVGHGVLVGVIVGVSVGVGQGVGVKVAVACMAGRAWPGAAAERAAAPATGGELAAGAGQTSPPNRTQAIRIAQQEGTPAIWQPHFCRLLCSSPRPRRGSARTQQHGHSRAWRTPRRRQARRPAAASPLQGQTAPRCNCYINSCADHVQTRGCYPGPNPAERDREATRPASLVGCCLLAGRCL